MPNRLGMRLKSGISDYRCTGALTEDHAEQLISEADAIIIPLQPSF